MGLVFIEQQDGQFQDDWVFAAFLGAGKHGYLIHAPGEKTYLSADKIVFFENQKRIPSGDHLVVASIQTTLDYFERIGFPVPAPINVPPELEKFGEREFGVCTIGDLKGDTFAKRFPLFIKPKNRLKEFAAGVLRSPKNINILLKEGENPAPPDETEVCWSSPVNMVSEYRCFVVKGKLEGIQWYAGDFTIFPEAHRIKSMISAYTDAPSCYTLDVAVVEPDNGFRETVIIEVNDGWCVGNYGFESKDYFRFLNIRWKEMMSKFIK